MASASKSPAIAATQIRQSNRILRKFIDDKFQDANKGIGITATDDYMTALRKVAPHVTGPQGDQWLKEKGFDNSVERIALVNQAKLIPVVDEQLADRQGRVRKAREGAVDANARSMNTLEGRARTADNSAFASDIENGLAAERLNAGRAAARARLADPNQPGGQRLKPGFWGSIADAAKSGLTLGAVSGQDIRIDVAAIQALKEGGRKVGVNVPELFPNLHYNSGNTDQIQRDYSKAYEMVDAAGGDPFGGAPRKLARTLRAAADAAEQFGRPAPLPGPVGGAAGAGAGFVPGRR